LRFCPYCSNRLREGHRYCGECGRNVEDETQPEMSMSLPTLESTPDEQVEPRASSTMIREKPPIQWGDVTILLLFFLGTLTLSAYHLGNVQHLASTWNAIGLVLFLIGLPVVSLSLVILEVKRPGSLPILYQLGWKQDENRVIERSRRYIPQDVRLTVWERDRGKCVECGSTRDLEFDHIVPVSKGGSNTVRNVQLLCLECNRRKHTQVA